MRDCRSCGERHRDAIGTLSGLDREGDAVGLAGARSGCLPPRSGGGGFADQPYEGLDEEIENELAWEL